MKSRESNRPSSQIIQKKKCLPRTIKKKRRWAPWEWMGSAGGLTRGEEIKKEGAGIQGTSLVKKKRKKKEPTIGKRGKRG